MSEPTPPEETPAADPTTGFEPPAPSSAFTQLSNELGQAPAVRQKLIEKIEKLVSPTLCRPPSKRKWVLINALSESANSHVRAAHLALPCA